MHAQRVAPMFHVEHRGPSQL